ncbi:MAG: hypothetical protein Q8N21_02155 [bacterium]|nr:hypothetical protein [bacterium]
MLKKIEFKLSKIKYKGKSIGDDICVEIEILDKIFRINKRIKVGKTVKLNKEIGSFLTDQKAYITEAKITVIEKDILFHEKG